MRYAAPKGTKDILPAQSGLWQANEYLFLHIAATYGYREIRTPIFEKTELFARGLGDATDVVQKEMFTFMDRGERSLTLRPELTAGVVRAYLEHSLSGEGPLCKLAYLGPAFRQERPQAGRYQQFTQYGVESFGSHDPSLDAEVIDLALAFIKTSGLNQVKLLLNSIGCAECRPLYRQALLKAVGERVRELCPTCQDRLVRNPMRVLDCKSPVCQSVLAGVPSTTDHLCTACSEHFQMVQRRLYELGIEYTLTPRLVRGLDYYTNTVFEAVAGGIGAQDAILGGGRYNGLIEACGGPGTPGVGFAGGMERLFLALAAGGDASQTSAGPSVFLVSLGDEAKTAAFRMAHELRQSGLATEMDYLNRSLKAQMREADRQGAKAAVIIGEEELGRGTATVRWLEGKHQAEVEIAQVTAYLTDRLQGEKIGTIGVV